MAKDIPRAQIVVSYLCNRGGDFNKIILEFIKVNVGRKGLNANEWRIIKGV